MSNSHTTFASPADALRALFAAWPSDKGDGTGLTEAYIIAIQGYSLKAIDGAVKRIIRGEVEEIDRRFLPTPAQLGNVVAYLEKLYEPAPSRQALPAPGSAERTPEEQARAESFIDRWRKANGREVTRGEIVTDREAIPQARREALDRAVETAAASLRDRSYTLSSEALLALTPMMSRGDLEAWRKENDMPTTPESKDKFAA